MQNAKDTFYVALQGRLAAINPSRTMVVRGVTRPGVMVVENELVSAFEPVDLFCLEWTAAKVDVAAALPLVSMSCAIRYATDGESGNGGMDRGRLLAAMDAELLAALNQAPHSTVKMNYAPAAGGSGVAPVAMGTRVFWDAPMFAPVKTTAERLERTVTVAVFSYQEAGEL